MGERVPIGYDGDDDGFKPGIYACGHGFAAGPARTRSAAKKALATFLFREGHLLQGVKPDIHVWTKRRTAT